MAAFLRIRYGQKLAQADGIMAARKALDRQPGAMPEIQADGDNVTFRFDVAGAPEGMKLVLRCDSKGEIWGAILIAADPRAGDR